MTEKFEFREPMIVLELCGNKFPITVGEETAKICTDILNDAKIRLEKMRRGHKDEALSESGICEFLKSGIERLIGSGAVDIIFGLRTQTVSDMAELICYIASKIKMVYLNEENH